MLADVRKVLSLKVFKAIIDVIYATPSRNKLLNVALCRKCLPTLIQMITSIN